MRFIVYSIFRTCSAFFYFIVVVASSMNYTTLVKSLVWSVISNRHILMDAANIQIDRKMRWRCSNTGASALGSTLLWLVNCVQSHRIAHTQPPPHCYHPNGVGNDHPISKLFIVVQREIRCERTWPTNVALPREKNQTEQFFTTPTSFNKSNISAKRIMSSKRSVVHQTLLPFTQNNHHKKYVALTASLQCKIEM